MNKRVALAVISVVAVVVVLIAAFWKPRQGVPSNGQKLVRVTVNQAFEHLLYIGLYVAKDAGFLEKQGLDVRIETGGGDAQAFAALTSGSAQFAQGDPGFVAIANE